MSLRALIVSDVHEDEALLRNIVNQIKPDIVIDGGDHNVQTVQGLVLPVPRYYTYGNHEPSFIEKIGVSNHPHSFENVHYLPHARVNRIKEKDEVLKIGVFGGNYGERAWNNIQGKTSPLQWRRDQLERILNSKERPEVLLTHETSIAHGLEYDGKNVGHQIIDDIIARLNPQFAISGHHHRLNLTTKDGVTYIALPQLSEGAALLEKSGNNTLIRVLYAHKDYSS